jgi:hypothetical protein
MSVRLTVRPWYRDLCSCLHVDVACLLGYYGLAPVQVLGAGWSFAFGPARFEPVEFFYPAPDGDIGRALAPHHSLTCRWEEPADREHSESELLELLEAGAPSIVAVDNYFLPFRPAYRDVHAAHLVVVTGFDEEKRTFELLDPIPPAFAGAVSADVLDDARSSRNPDDGTDPFFAGSGIRRRRLDVAADPDAPEVSSDWVERVLVENRASLLGPARSDGFYTGLGGLDDWLRALPERIAEDGAQALREIYVSGWAIQAATSLHGEFLASAGKDLDRPRLVEAGRWVDLVAHRWTPLRIAAAHRVGDPYGAGKEMVALGRQILRSWESALDRIDAGLEA